MTIKLRSSFVRFSNFILTLASSFRVEAAERTTQFDLLKQRRRQ